MNLEEIARLARVSRSTVSRVVNGDRRVSDDVRTRVQEVIRTHGYQPHAAARSLASRRTRILGLLIPGAVSFVFSDPYFPSLIQGIVDACNEADHGLMLMMEAPDDPASADRIYGRAIRGRHLDGVVLSTSLMGDPIVDRIVADAVPAVLIGRRTDQLAIPSIDVDNAGSSQEAVAHLIQHGRRRIAHIAGPLDIVAAIDRFSGYGAALAAAAIPFDPTLVVEGDFTEVSGHEAMRRLLAHPDGRPDAIFAGSDTMAVGALRAMTEAGCRVPDDIALCGFDGLERHAVAFPFLSTVVQPIAELGRTAVNTLLYRIGAPEAPIEHQVLPTRLARRGSCGCAVDEIEGRRAGRQRLPDEAVAVAG